MIQESHIWYLSKENEKGYQRGLCTPIIAALFTIAKAWIQTKCPSTGEWIKKILLSHKKEGHPDICDHMDGT